MMSEIAADLPELRCVDEVENLEESLLEAVRKNIVRRERFLIFETPFFFIGVVMLLLTEWFLCRRFNLFQSSFPSQLMKMVI
ncbi:MAG: hypothetical protein PHO37_02320 [Kiritimatiellae bacterium]|nr:hypothetical protein [Kiritimatiellia bacterium]